MRVFPEKFCANARPYWVLFICFVLSNILLVYTLYTRQPERYRRISRWLSVKPHRRTAFPQIQAANFVAEGGGDLAGQKNEGIGNTLQGFVNRVSPRPPRILAFLGMRLSDTWIERPKGKRGAGPVRGVEIVAIEGQSVAYLSGFRRGDVLVSVNRTPCLTLDDFAGIVGQSKATKGWLFDVFRAGEFYYMTIENGNAAP